MANRRRRCQCTGSRQLIILHACADVSSASQRRRRLYHHEVICDWYMSVAPCATWQNGLLYVPFLLTVIIEMVLQVHYCWRFIHLAAKISVSSVETCTKYEYD